MTETEAEFDVVDREAGVEVMKPAGSFSGVPVPANIIQYRDQLVREYYNGVAGLIQRLREEGKEDYEALLEALIIEIVKESDNLLGNQLVVSQNGDLRDASIISVKRAEIIEKVVKAVQEKQKFDNNRGVLDVDSSYMMEVFRFFMSKAKATLERMGVDPEMNDLFFRTFGDIASNWKRELKERLHAMANKS